MARNHDRIHKALAAKGYTPELIDWSPLATGAEKEGEDGGWEITLVEEVPPVDIDEYPNVGLAIDYTIYGRNFVTVMRVIDALPAIVAKEQG